MWISRENNGCFGSYLFLSLGIIKLEAETSEHTKLGRRAAGVNKII
jgi:hypothetical protein